MNLYFLTAGACASFILPFSACADVVFTSATRTIRAVGSNSTPGGSPPITSLAWTDFGYHNDFVEQTTQTINEPPGVMQRGYAQQESFIGSNWVALRGQVAFAENAISSGSGYCIGSSSAVVDMDVLMPTPWALTAGAGGSGFGGNLTIASISIVNLGTNLTVFSSPQLLNASGMLAPGTYRLNISITAGHSGAGTASTALAYDARFDIPAPGAACALAIGMCYAAGRRRPSR